MRKKRAKKKQKTQPLLAKTEEKKNRESSYYSIRTIVKKNKQRFKWVMDKEKGNKTWLVVFMYNRRKRRWKILSDEWRKSEVARFFFQLAFQGNENRALRPRLMWLKMIFNWNVTQKYSHTILLNMFRASHLIWNWKYPAAAAAVPATLPMLYLFFFFISVSLSNVDVIHIVRKYEHSKRHRMLQIAWMEGSNPMPFNEFDIIYQVVKRGNKLQGEN